MTIHLYRALRRALPALLGSAAIAAHAAAGFQVLPDQEGLVKEGMTMDQVRDALGRPSLNMKYRNQPGPTFTYLVTGNADYVFDVDFSADGRVVNAGERLSGNGGGDGGRRGRR